MEEKIEEIDIQKILRKQMQLLFECSVKTNVPSELAELSQAMVYVAKYIYDY